MKLRNVVLSVGALLVATPAFAEGTAPFWSASTLTPLAAAIAIGLAALGGAIGQSRAASAALEGMARNPQASLQTPMIIGLALIESLVIFAFLVANKILG